MIEFKIKDDKGISITLANTKIQKINIKQYIYIKTRVNT